MTVTMNSFQVWINGGMGDRMSQRLYYRRGAFIKPKILRDWVCLHVWCAVHVSVSVSSTVTYVVEEV